MRAFIVFATVVIGLCAGKVIEVKNGGQDMLNVEVKGHEVFSLHSGQSMEVTVSDKWVGHVKAWNAACKSHCTDVATIAEFTMNAVNGMDMYDVSVIRGFNRRMKIAPTGNLHHQCNAVNCQAHINQQCPKANQVTDAEGHVVACKNDAALFQKLCPEAVVTPKDQKVVQCDADKYLVILG